MLETSFYEEDLKVKSMKKLVLAGLVLLASVMVLVGCKMEPEVPPAKLNSITSLVQSAFSKDEIGDTMMIVVTYDNGTTKTVKGTITSDSSELTQSHGLNKEVIVSYSEGGITKEATFTIDVASYKFTETVEDYVYPTGQTGTASSTSTPQVTDPIYKQFGDWPQTIKGENIEIGSNTLTRGGFDYYVGSDGNYYVEHKSEYFYVGSDGNYYVEHKSEYYKVEPIVWRVLTKDYKVPGENGELQSTGRALLLAENILTGGIGYYVNSGRRTIGSATVYANNYKYSTIRAWLNGSYETDDTQERNYEGKGFLQTAFTTEAQDLIAETTVDNSAASTTDAGEKLPQATEYACDDTKDKIFLLSEQEATTKEYGFGEYYAYGQGNTRIRVTTDYAEATGAYQDGTFWWWLRSPIYFDGNLARIIYDSGNTTSDFDVRSINGGVVPALSISLK